MDKEAVRIVGANRLSDPRPHERCSRMQYNAPLVVLILMLKTLKFFHFFHLYCFGILVNAPAVPQHAGQTKEVVAIPNPLCS